MNGYALHDFKVLMNSNQLSPDNQTSSNYKVIQSPSSDPETLISAAEEQAERSVKREALLRRLRAYRAQDQGSALMQIGWIVLFFAIAGKSIFVFALALLLMVSALVLKSIGSRQKSRSLIAEMETMLAEANMEDLDLVLSLPGDPFIPPIRKSTLNRALMKILGRIRVDDAAAPTPESRNMLREMVVGSNIELALAVLSAFEYIGNAEDRATVHRVVSGVSPVQSSRVIEKARQVLPKMDERLLRASMGASLLRASSAPDGDTLLRAHTTPVEERPETLMRPASRSSEE
jgi:hypothetical protein